MNSVSQDLFAPTRHEMIAEVEREIALRHKVYPRRIEAKQLSQAKADRQIVIMAAILRLLQREDTTS